MKVHANAPLGPKGPGDDGAQGGSEREWSLAEAAAAAGVRASGPARSGSARYRAEGEPGLHDRSPAPRSIPHRTPEELVEAIAALRRLRMTGAEIAFCLAMALVDRLGGPSAGSGWASSRGLSRPSHPIAMSAAAPAS